MLKKLPILLLLGAASQAQAQLGATSLKGPGIGISTDFLPASHYIRPEDSVKTQSTTSQLRYNFGASFVLSSKTDTATRKMRMWTADFSGTYTKLDNKDYTKTIFPGELLQASAGLKYIHSLNNNWTLLAMVDGTIGTDMEEITFDDLFLQGGVLFLKQHNKRFAYGVGVVLTNAFGTPMVLPAFGIQYKTDSRFKIDINFPEKISIGTQLNSFTELALAVRVRGGAYDATNGVDGKKLMSYSEFSAGLESTWHLGHQFDFVVSCGSILASQVSYSDKKLSEMFKEKPSHRLATNVFMSAGLRWNIPHK
ncbi:hypothetical protein SAMN05444266_11123 [Chitinophaga jiangningensis]|uniref:DUF6268 domain-containing protein n=1 Tax=Chitinophaga jiangningensis TaxID=1419482 RepID=A0A1M7LKX4_9BACT|nr:DUF6268 family outer membrane beta-barrel protein [Chitinophaga jiangningensis]SHM78737.1 hypothetical protein SAMN05444266_11123 [Chitinophaga jiangningensis]